MVWRIDLDLINTHIIDASMVGYGEGETLDAIMRYVFVILEGDSACFFGRSSEKSDIPLIWAKKDFPGCSEIIYKN